MKSVKFKFQVKANFKTIPKKLTLVQILALSVGISGSSTYAAPDMSDTAHQSDGIRVQFPDQVQVPADNPMSPEKIELGKKLFFDTRLSSNNKISCNSCHNVMKAGDDGLPRSPGHAGKEGARNSPTVWNAAFHSVQFWDGRAPSLEEQAKGPIVNPIEMGMESHDKVVELISKVPSYKKEFEKVYGPGKVTIDKMVKAIAAYERTLITPNSPYDRFIKGDRKALNPAAQRGMKLVETVGCTTCHNGPMFAGPVMPPGQGFYQKFPLIPGSEYEKKYNLNEDLGRYAATKNEADKNMWRVPTWRNVAITAPYFHNGSVSKLDEAVRVMAKTQLGKTLSSDEVRDIVAFLTSLTGERPKQTKPIFPPSTKKGASSTSSVENPANTSVHASVHSPKEG